eukprot:10102-Eustigmatos_ZCMA.PRE.1
MGRTDGAFNGGRVFPVLCRPVEAGLLAGLVAWTPGHDVAYVSADGQQAQRLFEHAVHGLSVSELARNPDTAWTHAMTAQRHVSCDAG